MERLDYRDLDDLHAAFDADVRATPWIDGYCSSTDWVLPAAYGLEAGRAPWIWRGRAGWVALSMHRDPRGARVALALESMWGLSCPVVGSDRARLAREFARAIRAHRGEWDAIVLSGFAPADPFVGWLAAELVEDVHVRFADRALRNVASLAGGFEGFLARRTRDFRRSLRRARRDAERAALEIQDLRPADDIGADAAYARCLAIEERSHKGRKGDGILGTSMRSFYADMARRVARRGALRARFARLEGEDVGFLLGASWERSFRALQCSYVEEHARLSIGNVLQARQIEDLCGEGVERYDLGSDVPYKRRWGEILDVGLRVLIVR